MEVTIGHLKSNTVITILTPQSPHWLHCPNDGADHYPLPYIPWWLDVDKQAANHYCEAISGDETMWCRDNGLWHVMCEVPSWVTIHRAKLPPGMRIIPTKISLHHTSETQSESHISISISRRSLRWGLNSLSSPRPILMMISWQWSFDFSNDLLLIGI